MALVAECKNSGMTVLDWCKQKNISVSTFYTWQKKSYSAMKESENTTEFYEIGSVSKNFSPIATIQYNTFKIEISNGAEEETIKNILRALKSC